MTIRGGTNFGATILAALAVAGAAQAQDKSVVETTGYVELEHIEGDGNVSDTFLFGDVNFSVGGGLIGAAPGLGFDAGVVAVTDGDDDETAVYAAATYSFGASKFSVGIPRSAYDTFSNMPPVGGLRILDFSLGELNEGLVEFLYLVTDETPYGLRYDGDYGALQVAASAHTFDGEDIDGYAVAARYGLTENFAVFADWENIVAAGGNISTTRIGGETDYGNWSGGLSYFNRDPDGSNHIDGTETWLTYRPTEAISVTGTALNTNIFDVYGLSMRYDWPVGIYGQIGAADGRETDTLFDFSVGFEF